MALLMPQNQLARNIDTILSQIRKGCARARVANQGDPTLGIMVDLPDGVEFEITVIREYQSLTRITNSVSNDVAAIAQSRITGNEKSSESSDETVNEAGNEEKSQEISRQSQETTQDESTTRSGSAETDRVVSTEAKGEDSEESETRDSTGTENRISSRVATKTAVDTATEEKDNQEATAITEGKTESDEQGGGKSLQTKGVNNDFAENSRGYATFEDETGVRGADHQTYPLNYVPLGSCGVSTQE